MLPVVRHLSVISATAAAVLLASAVASGAAAVPTATPSPAPSDPPTGSPWVTGYYAGWYWDQGCAPDLVDMGAMTHFVFGRVAPGGGSLSGEPGEIVLGAGSAHDPDASPYPGVTVEDAAVGFAHASGTKALLMLGGDGFDGRGFVASADDAVRATFVENLVDYLVAHDYDGVDVDWENCIGGEAWECGIDISVDESARRLTALLADHRGCARSVLTTDAVTSAASAALGRELGYDEVMHLAALGDPGARRVVDDAARGLGRLIAAIANLTMPELVVLGGEGVRLAEIGAAAVQEGIASDRDPRATPVQLVTTSGDDTEWCRGAAVIAIQDYVAARSPR